MSEQRHPPLKNVVICSLKLPSKTPLPIIATKKRKMSLYGRAGTKPTSTENQKYAFEKPCPHYLNPSLTFKH